MSKIELPARAFCVTIPRLSDRRKLFRENWGDDVSFHFGVDYKTDDLAAILKQHGKRMMYEGEVLGRVACYLSHLSLWKRLLTEPENEWLIFEDDAGPTGDAFAPPVGDLFRYFRNPPPHPIWSGNVCYYVTRPFVERLVEHPYAAGCSVFVNVVANAPPVFADPIPVVQVAPFCSYDVAALLPS